MSNLILKHAKAAVLVGSIVLSSSCVNKIDSEISTGTIPITFSSKVSNNNTRVTNTAFEKGDKVGLYAIISGTSITDKRYIDNLWMECGDNGSFIPEKTVFYPTGEATLDFISYFPYQQERVQAGKSTIPVSVQPDQSDLKNLASSDFLVATKKDVESSEEAVILSYRHKLTKIKITITPGKGENISQMYNSNPRIIATGFKTKADYDLEKGVFINLSNETDIIPTGKWNLIDGALSGKEFIVIPQNITTETKFIMEWNGKIYTCPMPELTMKESTQCKIDITALQTTSQTLTGIVGEIEDWADGESKSTENNGDISTVHLAALTFAKSNIYRIYHNGKPMAEVCKEYLKSDKITSRATVAYPVKEDEESDLSRGIVLQLHDYDGAIAGGTISWNIADNTFTYEEGTAQSIEKFYLNEAGEILLEKTGNTVSLDILSHTLRDIRRGSIKEYSLVKIGTQYWMRKDLCATTNNKGNSLTKLTKLGKTPGYYKPNEYEIYFYNGEAVLKGDLAPAGWKIPNEDDWNALKTYTGNDASILKAGEWEALAIDTSPKSDPIVCEVSNLTGFTVYPLGMWGSDKHLNKFQLAGYWTLNDDNTIPKETVFFIGSSNEFYIGGSFAPDQDYYKALSIRCIKE